VRVEGTQKRRVLDIEHSDFTDEYGFRSYRIVQKARTMAMAI